MDRNIIFNEMKNDRICVFHNEVIARYFAIEYAYTFGAIEAEKAISYDTFREFFLPAHEGLEEVNNQIREFFIIEFLEKNSLKYLINNDFPESINRFISYMVNVLKQLKRLKDNEIYKSLDSDFIYDVDILYSNYLEFLKKNNLFDPFYEIPSINFAPKNVLEKSYTIISGDTKIGCTQFLKQLNYPKFIKVLNVDSIEKKATNFENNCKLLSFDNTQELQNNLFRKVKQLLDDNVYCRDIAITLCNFDNDIQDIEDKAKRFDIPISKAKGYNLLKYPGGKYLSYLSHLYDNNFSIEDMKSFFLDRSFPFKDFSLNRELIRYAIDANIDHGSKEIEKDYWSKRLVKNPKLNEFYWKFKNIIISINTINNIAALKKALHTLENLLFVEDLGWKGSSGEDSYSFAMDKLETLKKSMNACNIDKTNQIFKVYIRMIEKENYVEQGHRDGIKIYEYPLSASLDIPYHFIVDINSKTSEVVDKPLFILPPNIEDQNIREEEDITNNVINDYCLNSGISLFLFSYTTYEGAQLAPSIFMEKNSIYKANFSIKNKPYINEISLWNKENIKEDLNLTHFQAKAFEFASNNVLKFDQNGFVNHNIESEINDFLLDKIRTQDKFKILKFSSTSINLFKKCPYAFAIKYLFKVQKNEYNVNQYDAMQIGTIIHSIFETFFKKVMKEDRQFYSSKYNEYVKIFDEIKNQKLNEYFIGELSPPISTQIYIKDKLKNLASEFLSVEVKEFDTYKSIEMEKSYKSCEEIEINDKSYFYALNGKIDRVINLNNGNYAIVDYKSGKAPVSKTWHKKAYKAGVSELPDYQFACYKKFLNKEKMNVSRATYYSVAASSYCDMWNDSVLEDQTLIDNLFDNLISDIISQILKGDFRATPSKENCEHCDYRQVCRKRYSTK